MNYELFYSLCTTNKKVPTPSPHASWRPCIVTTKRKPIEVTFIHKDQLFGQVVVSNQEFIQSAVILVSLNCRSCYLRLLAS